MEKQKQNITESNQSWGDRSEAKGVMDMDRSRG